jgi:hypothetical protein
MIFLCLQKEQIFALSVAESWESKNDRLREPHDAQRERQLFQKSSFVIRRWLKLSVSVAFFSWQNGISAVC